MVPRRRSIIQAFYAKIVASLTQLGRPIVLQKLVRVAVPVLVAGGAQASSYLREDGTVIDSIQSVFGGDHPYSG